MNYTIQLPGSPFGIAWFFLYGYSGVPAAEFMPKVRELEARFTKVYLFWQQIEPQPGCFDWTALDAFVNQLDSREEGLIALFSSSLWAVKRPSAMLPPSPATDLEKYYRFVFETVRRCRGRVRYWQNDAEPNNPLFWSGTKEEFVAQLHVFYRAVKDADPEAIVVVGGYEGMFVPPDMMPLPGQRTTPFPQQQAGLDFFDFVFEQGRAAFDLFDLRLYGDPYSILPRVEYMRKRMAAHECVKPVICTEYGGPNLFEFAANRQYLPLVAAWSAGMGASYEVSTKIEELYARIEKLPPETQMFMQGCPADLEARYHRIQSRSIVMRNLFALAAGVQKTLYWQLVNAPGNRSDLMTLMYGKIGLLDLKDGELNERKPAAGVFARMASVLAGVRAVKRLELPAHPSIFLFEVDRGERVPIYVAWERRDPFSGEDDPPVAFDFPWPTSSAKASDAFGSVVPVQVVDARLHLPVSITPLYIEPEN